MRFVHAADLHLDSPLRGLCRLGDAETARTLRAASRGALENLVRLVIAEKAPLLVLAGDIYDGDWRDYDTGRFFTEQMDRLNDEQVRVVMASGNHDAESEITRSLLLPPNVSVLDVHEPESVEFEDLGVVVHGQGFARRAVLANLASAFPDRRRGLVNVGVLHCTVDGRDGHDPYAPCSLAELLAKGYDYFALGHIHTHAVLAEGEHTVAYSGNLQGRTPRETGPKGAVLVDVAAGEGAVAEFRELDVARWEHLRVPVAECAGLHESLDAVEREFLAAATAAQDRLVVVRVELTGRTPAAADLADSDRVRAEIGRIADRTGVTLERVRVRVQPPTQLLSVDDDLRDAIGQAVVTMSGDLSQLRAGLAVLSQEVGLQLREAGLLSLSDRDTLADLVTRAASSLECQLTGGTR
jgi:exonuclease SbcD